MGRKEQEGSPYETPVSYGDGDIPEIDLSGTVDATNDIPDELLGRGQSGRMRSMQLE